MNGGGGGLTQQVLEGLGVLHRLPKTLTQTASAGGRGRIEVWRRNFRESPGRRGRRCGRRAPVVTASRSASQRSRRSPCWRSGSRRRSPTMARTRSPSPTLPPMPQLAAPPTGSSPPMRAANGSGSCRCLRKPRTD